MLYSMLPTDINCHVVCYLQMSCSMLPTDVMKHITNRCHTACYQQMSCSDSMLPMSCSMSPTDVIHVARYPQIPWSMLVVPNRCHVACYPQTSCSMLPTDVIAACYDVTNRCHVDLACYPQMSCSMLPTDVMQHAKPHVHAPSDSMNGDCG